MVWWFGAYTSDWNFRDYQYLFWLNTMNTNIETCITCMCNLTYLVIARQHFRLYVGRVSCKPRACGHWTCLPGVWIPHAWASLQSPHSASPQTPPRPPGPRGASSWASRSLPRCGAERWIQSPWWRVLPQLCGASHYLTPGLSVGVSWREIQIIKIKDKNISIPDWYLWWYL